jgi:hypothetical protein
VEIILTGGGGDYLHGIEKALNLFAWLVGHLQFLDRFRPVELELSEKMDGLMLNEISNQGASDQNCKMEEWQHLHIRWDVDIFESMHFFGPHDVLIYALLG